jgi:hypothetical protein
VGVDPLGMLLAQSFANHLLEFGVSLDFSGHVIVGQAAGLLKPVSRPSQAAWLVASSRGLE